jgi:succinate dehydrogenase / fumarate reductase cytochrome b subunit
MASSKNFFASSIGQKLIMAVSGALLFLFIIGHLAGNLQIFLGQKALNDYAVFLKSLGAGLWVMRIGLIAIVLGHFIVAIRLYAQNKAARPQSYKTKNFEKASFASRYMMHAGMIITIFVVVHLLHFTLGVLNPEAFNLVDSQGNHDVYSMVILGFRNQLYSVGYIIAMLMLGLHLSHGLQSVFQSLGIHHSGIVRCARNCGAKLGWLIALGYISIPVAVLAGILKLPGEG